MSANYLSHLSVARLGAIFTVAATLSACGVDKQTAPSLMGPSGEGLSLNLSASPDILPRDGSSQSVITLTALDDQSAPVVGRRFVLALSTSPTAGGILSAGEIVTGSNGQATFAFVAPEANMDVTSATIHVTPVGEDFGSLPGRSVRVALVGPDIPSPSFTFTPASPARFAEVGFDASGSTLAGSACGSGCTFDWAFGTEATATGQIVQHRFQSEGVHTVTLTVTSNATGISRSTTRTVTVGASTAPTAAFSFSPANPETGDDVHFNASDSAGANGASVVEFRWDFGNGQSQTTTSATTTLGGGYADARSYNVRLTVVDSNGQTASVQQSVTVAEP